MPRVDRIVVRQQTGEAGGAWWRVRLADLVDERKGKRKAKKYVGPYATAARGRVRRGRY